MNMNTVLYKNYVAQIKLNVEDGILVGRVINISDIIGFHGNTIAETIDSFHVAIDEYFADCKEKGLAPNKPCSGRFNLRIPPRLHSEFFIAAAKAGKSLNQWTIDALDQTLQSSL
ncbi:MAG: type II toxin-antitoxin system HicB family antitoxin [Thermodesulfobacteriota bacterium]|nr:type II toxin-antitoxin system HicB family antitoxin [Thermodesulfobacteriota bacterium]